MKNSIKLYLILVLLLKANVSLSQGAPNLNKFKTKNASQQKIVTLKSKETIFAETSFVETSFIESFSARSMGFVLKCLVALSGIKVSFKNVKYDQGWG